MTEPIYITVPTAETVPATQRPDRSRNAASANQELEQQLANLRRQQAALTDQERTRTTAQQQRQTDPGPGHTHDHDRERHIELD